MKTFRHDDRVSSLQEKFATTRKELSAALMERDDEIDLGVTDPIDWSGTAGWGGIRYRTVNDAAPAGTAGLVTSGRQAWQGGCMDGPSFSVSGA
jgi:hypothetical protein